MEAPNRSAASQRGEVPALARKFRAGRIQALVKAQKGDQGVWYSISFQRSYKDGQGQWRTSESFGVDDLLTVSELSRMAWQWVIEHRAQNLLD